MAAGRAGPLGQEGLIRPGLTVAAAKMVTQSWFWVRRKVEIWENVRAGCRDHCDLVGRAGARRLRLAGRGFVPDAEFRDPVPARSVASFREKQLGPVAPDDLVDSSGRCAGAVVPATSGDQPGNVSLPDAGVPMIPAGIALEMSECDVVKRAGFPEQVNVGANERGERTVTLTYINGQRPGIYNFTSGRLTSMERAPEPPPSARTAKKPAKPPARRAAQPNRTSVQ